MQAYQEITAVKYVTGKDENGADLQLTRVSWHRYDKDDAGEIGPDHNDEGSTLFLGNISGDAVVTALSALNEADSNIKTFYADGVVAA